MKIIITETERGFLFRNGVYRKLLEPGKHTIWSRLGESYLRVKVTSALAMSVTDIVVLMRDPQVAAQLDRIDVPDGHIAIHMEDGRIISGLSPGTYCFWNCYRKHTFELIDISKAEITQLSRAQLLALPSSLYTSVEVSDGETKLLFLDGKFQRTLTSGRYYFWKNTQRVVCQSVDPRAQQLEINGQEILTADKVSLRINFVCSYRITDAVHIVTEITNYESHIYNVTQLALREHVGAFRFDELLEQKDTIADYVLKKLQAKQESLFVEFSDAGIKDIILPGEIRDIMNTVLVAEKTAQANVIARREEVASTRSLLNTAKLMEENDTLYKLKELEYLERICDKVGNISVGNGNLLGELREILSARQ